MFKDKLKEIRKNYDHTQESLARKLNISRQSISKWENGLSYPTKTMLNKICEEFNVNVSDLLNQEELMYISIDNVNKIKTANKRTVIIISSIFLIAFSIIILGILFSNRLKRIENTNEKLINNNPLLGYIILDETGINNYDKDDEDSIQELIDSKLYPYCYFNLDRNFWDDNKLYSHFYSSTNKEMSSEAMVYVKKNTKIFIMHIMYDIENQNIYLDNSGGILLNASISITRTFGDQKNSILNLDSAYKLTITTGDELQEVEIYEYNDSNILLKSTRLVDLDSLSLHKDTLYFVIKEVYKDVDNVLYINKLHVTHNDFDKYYHYSFKVFDVNNFAGYKLIQLDTIINP